MDFDFNEVIYVTSIDVYATGYEIYHELEMSYEDFLSKSVNSEKVRFDGAVFRFKLNRFVGGFGLRPSDSWFKDSKLTRIEVSGVEQKHFSEVTAIFHNLNKEKEKIEIYLNQYLERARVAEAKRHEVTAEIETLEAEIDSANAELSKLTAEVDGHSKDLESVKKQVAIAEAVKRNIDEQTQIAKNNNDVMAGNSEKLAIDISNKENKLRSLENDINLFPTEIAGYVTQGSKNVSLYWKLCAIPLVVIAVVTFRLFMNSEKILNYVYQENFSIVEFLISRVPYVAVSTVILAVCYTLLHRLITEIIGINRRRQDLFKVSIIATDISYASQTGLELSDADRYNLRTQTKMELLKEHLKQHISEEYIYSPKSSLVHKVSTIVASAIADDEKEATPGASPSQ